MTTRHTHDCAAFGVPFRLTAGSAEQLACMRECLPWSTQIAAPSSAFASAAAPEFSLSHCGDSADQRAALDALTRDLMTHVAEHAPDRVFVHAGVVAMRGRAILLPGASFAGKTTLVAELIRAGAIYYSDEYAVLDSAGLVHPYPRPLAMRVPGSDHQSPLPARELGAAIGSHPIPAALVVFTQFAAGALWQPRPITHGMAALELMRHAIPVQRTPARVMAVLACMLNAATCLDSPRGEAAATASHLLTMFEACT